MTTTPDRLGFMHTDGGRASAGYTGTAGDCVVRAIAIALEKPYQEVYDTLNTMNKSMRWHDRNKNHYSSRDGMHKRIYSLYMAHQPGWSWVALMKIGTGCRHHLRPSELPTGRIICRVSKHLVAVIDHVIHDNHDCSRDGTRCVYGYYKKD